MLLITASKQGKAYSIAWVQCHERQKAGDAGRGRARRFAAVLGCMTLRKSVSRDLRMSCVLTRAVREPYHCAGKHPRQVPLSFGKNTQSVYE